MRKNYNTLLVFLLIMAQSILGIGAGAAALLNTSRKALPASVYVEELSLGGMSYTSAQKKIESSYSEKFEKGTIRLEVEKGKTYEIPFSQINAGIDVEATLQSVGTVKSIRDIPVLFHSFFGHSKHVLQPVIRFDEGKLRQVLLGLSEDIYIPPVDARISYKDHVIHKQAETSGIALNVSNAVDIIRMQLSADPWGTVLLSGDKNYELQSVEPSEKLKEYDDIQQVLAEYTTEILDDELIGSIDFAVNSINGVIMPAKTDTGDPQVFSFVECLRSKSDSFENDNEGYDQVASTLYAALLSAGIPYGSITRMAHKLEVDYIEPGLDAWISGNAGDLRFSNPFGNKLAVFAQREANKVRVVIAGNIGDKNEDYEIHTEITQRFAPPVYNIENSSLKLGEMIVLNPGKEGIAVEVYVNGERIYTDTYEAEKKIVQIGPGTNWNNDNK